MYVFDFEEVIFLSVHVSLNCAVGRVELDWKLLPFHFIASDVFW